RHYGAVLMDDDFNLDESGEQGSGTDRVSYRIPIGTYDGDITVTAKVYFQVTPPRWLASMFEYESEDIDLFEWMYESSDKDPVLVASDEIISGASSVELVELDELITIYPNPTFTGEVAIRNSAHFSIDEVEIWDAAGKLCYARDVRGNTVFVQLPDAAGLYFVHVKAKDSRVVYQVLRY
ncbi:MAG: T9SS type A sorting domain-containing protein, partial [Flavobacteriales bacterium]|nr:T9SS type A sorting domain-containing protein [Flavobacteriales bacterium]